MGHFDIVILVASAIFYYRLGEIEYGRGWLTGCLSVGAGVGVAYLFAGGTLLFLVAQALLYAALTAFNFFRRP
mgnify:CR=1 FL=1